MIKRSALYFYQYLPPWRIDVFNEIAKIYDLTIVFTNANCEGFTYDRKQLLSKLNNVNTVFINNGFNIGSKAFRVGIYKILREYKPDVVFSHEYSPTSMLCGIYKKINLFSYKYYVTTSDNVKIAQRVRGLKAKVRKTILSTVDGVIVYSQGVKEWYNNHFLNLNIMICPNIQNPKSLLKYRSAFPNIINKYKIDFGLESSKIILFIGRLVDEKGLDLLLEAFSDLQDKSYKLVIVGSGKNQNNLEIMCSELKISDKVIFAGYYSGEKLYAWYDLANFFVLPSRYEPFGAVVNEALIYGCPVLASKYIGALDFISDNNGFVFDPFNKSDFVSKLNLASKQYESFNLDKKNLMSCDFENYINVFKDLS